MLDGHTPEARTGSWAFTLVTGSILFLMEFIFFAALVPTDWSADVRATERAWMQDELGPETTGAILARTDAIYGLLLERTGLVAGSYRILLPSAEDTARAGALDPLARMPLWEWVRGRLDVVWGTVYQAIQRLVVLVAWWPYFALLLPVAGWDGWQRRRIRQAGFAYASPLLYRVALLGTVGVVFVAGLLLLAPVPLPVLGVPLVGVVLAVLVGVGVAEAQKRL
jgi:hypothetical protein